MISASAPAKLILCGEHAVVYNQPAIALPLADIRAYASVSEAARGSGIHFAAPDLGNDWQLNDAPNNPLNELAQTVLTQLGLIAHDLQITMRSDIPIASGMGSGAAIATALVRALSQYAGQDLGPAAISELVYESERRFHGTPSGIDNTVVAYERAIWFQRQSPEQATIQPVAVGAPLVLIVGDTGVRSATRLPVGAVRAKWQEDPATYDAHFQAIGDLVHQSRQALAAGDQALLGSLLNENQEILRRIGVSSPELERMIEAAQGAGALGAKLAGAGWGGVMLALGSPETQEAISAALRQAGASQVYHTSVPIISL